MHGMRKCTAVLVCIVLTGILAGCGGDSGWDTGEGLEEIDLSSVEELYRIRVTAGDAV